MNTLSCQWNQFAEESICLPRPLEKEFMRKMLHLPVFIFPFIALYSVTTAIVALLFLAASYMAIIVCEKRFNKTIPVFSTIISSCKRDVGYDFGPFYLALGMVVALCIASPRDVFFAAYVIAICDSAASLIGTRFGKNRIPLFGKSYIGSATFFATCFLGGLFFFTPLESLIAASCLVTIELISIKGLDNFTLPVISQLLLLMIW